MNKKINLIGISICSLILLIIVIAMFMHKPNDNSFSLEIINIELTENNVNLAVELKNNSIGFYNIRFEEDFIRIRIIEIGSDTSPGYIYVARNKIMLPFSTLKKREDIPINNKFDYEIIINSKFSVRNVDFKLEKTIQVVNGVIQY